jgi:glycosyltransferase involved in cell wall biosynthesis
MILSNPFMVDPRVYKEAKALSKAGYEVSVIVWDRKNSYEKEDTVEGIRLFRIHNKGLMNILPHDLVRNPLWWWKAYKKGLKLYKNGFDFDVVHCHDLDTLVAGVLLKKKLDIKLVYDAHEIFGYMVLRDMPKIVASLAFWLEKKIVKFVDCLIVAESTYLNHFKKIMNTEMTTVLNCKDLVIDEYTTSENDVFTLIYIGVLNKSRFFPDLMHVIGNINGVRLIIAGKKENMYDEVQKISGKYSNITFLGSIPYSEVLPRTLDADVVVCMINPVDINNRIATANKQFEAMVCGRPIICTKGTRSGEITKQYDCGLVIEYTKDALKKAIIQLRDDPNLREKLGKNALQAAITKYNWENEERKLLNMYEKVN